MNITPWVKECIRRGVEQPGSQEPYYSGSSGTGLAYYTDDNWKGNYVESISVNEMGIVFCLFRTFGGTKQDAYAWDELDEWGYGKAPLEGYAIRNRCFRLTNMGESVCLSTYNLFVMLSCAAHVMTRGVFPSMTKGVALGYIDPSGRDVYDSNGFPNERFRAWAKNTMWS